MLRYFTLTLLAAAVLCTGACTQPPQDAPLTHYKYPAEKILGSRFAPDKHFAITVFDEGTGGKPKITAVPSAKNQLGDKQTVTDENLIFIDGRAYTYLAFYDDWTIQESVEAVFDKDGNLVKTITVLYNKNGVPVSMAETSVL